MIAISCTSTIFRRRADGTFSIFTERHWNDGTNVTKDPVCLLVFVKAFFSYLRNSRCLLAKLAVCGYTLRRIENWSSLGRAPFQFEWLSHFLMEGRRLLGNGDMAVASVDFIGVPLWSGTVSG